MTKPRFSCKMTKRQKMVGNGVFLDEYETLYQVAAIVAGKRIDLGYVDGLAGRNRALAIARKRLKDQQRIQDKARKIDYRMASQGCRASDIVFARV